MSKIQINQLNTSEFNELNSNETADVVGGRRRWGKYYKKITYNTSVNFQVSQKNIDNDFNQVTIFTGNAKKGASSGVGVTINSGSDQNNTVALRNFSI